MDSAGARVQRARAYGDRFRLHRRAIHVGPSIAEAGSTWAGPVDPHRRFREAVEGVTGPGGQREAASRLPSGRAGACSQVTSRPRYPIMSSGTRGARHVVSGTCTRSPNTIAPAPGWTTRRSSTTCRAMEAAGKRKQTPFMVAVVSRAAVTTSRATRAAMGRAGRHLPISGPLQPASSPRRFRARRPPDPAGRMRGSDADCRRPTRPATHALRIVGVAESPSTPSRTTAPVGRGGCRCQACRMV